MIDKLFYFLSTHGPDLFLWWLAPALALNVVLDGIKLSLGKLKWCLRLSALAVPMTIAPLLYFVCEDCTMVESFMRGVGVGFLAIFLYDARVYPAMVLILKRMTSWGKRESLNKSQGGFISTALLPYLGMASIVGGLLLWVFMLRAEVSSLESELDLSERNVAEMRVAVERSSDELGKVAEQARLMAVARSECLEEFERFRADSDRDTEILCGATVVPAQEMGVVDAETSDLVLERLAGYLGARVVRGETASP